jgi:hypothetical protein
MNSHDDKQQQEWRITLAEALEKGEAVVVWGNGGPPDDPECDELICAIALRAQSAKPAPRGDLNDA